MLFVVVIIDVVFDISVKFKSCFNVDDFLWVWEEEVMIHSEQCCNFFYGMCSRWSIIWFSAWLVISGRASRQRILIQEIRTCPTAESSLWISKTDDNPRSYQKHDPPLLCELEQQPRPTKVTSSSLIWNHKFCEPRGKSIGQRQRAGSSFLAAWHIM